ncbi:MAG: DUF507 family protein [Bdellovibrionales bacterium]|nr:DUF507 family protein [Bdellovibrionales bacterium]
MKITEKQISRLAKVILTKLEEQNQIVYKVPNEKVLTRAMELLRADFQRERDLDEEVNRMMDDLERQNPGSFQRFKMFPLLKKKLAKEKGIVL